MKKDYHSIPHQNYEFGYNRDLPDEHAIVNEMPDFGEILEKAQKVKQVSRFRKLTIIIGSGAGIAASVAILWFSGLLHTKSANDISELAKNDSAKIVNDSNFATTTFTPANQLRFIQINASADVEIKLGSNASIKVPKGTLVDMSGKAVEGNQTIAYKLLENAQDVLKGKVPLVVNSGDGALALNPKLMFEVYAAGLQIAQGKSIEIAANNIPQCNLYVCQKSDASWKLDRMLTDETLTGTAVTNENKNLATTEIKTNNSELNNISRSNESTNNSDIVSSVRPSKEQPIKPRLRNPSIPGFEIMVDKAKHPELAKYEKMVFEVKDPNTDLTTEDHYWTGITVEKSNKIGEYLVTLREENRSISVIAYPVFSRSADFRKANEEYKQWQLAQQAPTDRVVMDISTPNPNTEHTAERPTTGVNSSNSSQPAKSKLNTLKIKLSKFGLYALANPKAMLPQVALVKLLKFETENGKSLPSVIYQKSRNGQEVFQTSYNNNTQSGWINLNDEWSEIVAVDETSGDVYYSNTKDVQSALNSKEKVVKMQKKKEN